jgi:hypothetical protein
VTSTEQKSSAFHAERIRLSRNLRGAQKELEALDLLGDIAEIGSAMAWFHTAYGTAPDPVDGHSIDLQPITGVDARVLAMRVLERVRVIMPNPPLKVDKTFDASSGKITYTIEGPLPGWTLKVSGGEPRCKMKKIETPVYFPAKTVPARTEMVVRYEIENPEECLGATGTHKEEE